MNFTKDIVINDVTIRLHRLSAKQQHDIVNRFFFPITTQATDLLGVMQKQPDNKIAIAAVIMESVNKYLPADKRDELIFKHLMPSVKIVAAGIEVDYCSPNGEIMSDAVNNLKVLYKITFEVLKFNFDDFFTDWLNENKLS